MRFPRELILLGGAPGAGKGTNSDFTRKVRGITAPPIVVSQLLETPEARAVKARGAMVGDREVVGILLRKLLEPEQQNGALLDGFPRTKVQVECLKLLFVRDDRAATGVFDQSEFLVPIELLQTVHLGVGLVNANVATSGCEIGVLERA